jgi:hypothetical protein
VNPWWWVPIGLAAWSLLAIGVAMLVGPVLRHSSRARESRDQELLDSELQETADKREPPQDERQAS